MYWEASGLQRAADISVLGSLVLVNLVSGTFGAFSALAVDSWHYASTYRCTASCLIWSSCCSVMKKPLLRPSTGNLGEEDADTSSAKVPRRRTEVVAEAEWAQQVPVVQFLPHGALPSLHAASQPLLNESFGEKERHLGHPWCCHQWGASKTCGEGRRFGLADIRQV